MDPVRRSVSRETRLLLVTVLISLTTLWVLARIRFPEQPRTPNPVSPVLAQLAPPSALDTIASSLVQLQPRIASLLTIVPIGSGESLGGRVQSLTALRYTSDLGLGLLRGATASWKGSADASLVAFDGASGLAVVKVEGASAQPFETWTPQRLQSPRFLIAADPSPDGIVLRPVFIGSLHLESIPTWPAPIWTISAQSDLEAGTFVFTDDGALAGLTVASEGRRAIVPADVMIAAADRLVQQGHREPGEVGIEVQPLTPELSRGLGVTRGAVITWVDPGGPAAAALQVADVIDQLEGQPLTTIEQWRVRVARLAAGDSIALKVLRGGELRDAQFSAVPRAVPATPPPLGLTVSRIRGTGSEIQGVERQSAAERAGLRIGDVITKIGGIERPTPAEVSQAFTAAPDDVPTIVAVTRGDQHLLLSLSKTW